MVSTAMRLRALPADAAEWRHARRQALPEPEDRRLHDVRPPRQRDRDEAAYLPGPGYGFGLGFAVRAERRSGASPEAGNYYWGGAGGTYFWVDPKTDLFVVLMLQSPKERVHYRTLLHDMVYAAVMK